MLAHLISYRLFPAETRLCAASIQSRSFRRRPPNQGKPPILPPSKKVLYNVVHVPWQSPEDVKELLWRRHVYNNAVMSLKEVFRQEIREAEAAGKGIEAMKEEEDAEFNRLIAENDMINQKKTKHSRSKHKLANEASAEVRAAIDRSKNFVGETNLEKKILEALENPKVYDFAIDRQGRKYYDSPPMKYQEGVPTRQKRRFFDRTLGVSQGSSEIEKEPEPDVQKASNA
ncbi:hypothetical protein KIN20_000414 [Parelaphostrongylus tenuis]|uniref:Small ribosomal subunit protein mS26 n=1 Tax=Parelaphostrongylus tenuis TaxID=148309 RepID=A0AAD5LW33_PARTN|nr:hypothetical protein KIN20_000414 [Parelaphostrongylus tenuis]